MIYGCNGGVGGKCRGVGVGGKCDRLWGDGG